MQKMVCMFGEFCGARHNFEAQIVTCPWCGSRWCESQAQSWSFTAPESLNDVPRPFWKQYIEARKLATFKAYDHFYGWWCDKCRREWITQESVG